MDFDPSRLRRGEFLVGASGLVLLASMFLLDWYGLKARLVPTAAALGRTATFDGWDALSHLRWLLLVTIALSLSLALFQAVRSAPAIPVSLSVIMTVFGLLSLLALIYRVLVDPPGSDHVLELKLGAFIGLGSAALLTYGGYLSMREEGVAPRDGPAEIETVRLPGTPES